MKTTEVDLYRSVRAADFPDGTILEGQPVSAVLYPDFEPKLLPSGDIRNADVTYSSDKL